MLLLRLMVSTLAAARWLTVNRYNDHTIDVYKHWGFTVAREQCADIGNGFVMDDYVMELEVKL